MKLPKPKPEEQKPADAPKDDQPKAQDPSPPATKPEPAADPLPETKLPPEPGTASDFAADLEDGIEVVDEPEPEDDETNLTAPPAAEAPAGSSFKLDQKTLWLLLGLGGLLLIGAVALAWRRRGKDDSGGIQPAPPPSAPTAPEAPPPPPDPMRAYGKAFGAGN